MKNILQVLKSSRVRLLIFLSIFGPATITAMADNDASGVATYAIAGAKLGYPILFALLWITVLLGVTQEMGIRISLVTRKGFGSLMDEIASWRDICPDLTNAENSEYRRSILNFLGR